MRYFIIVEGTALSGFRFTGPFGSHHEAALYAESNLKEFNVVAELHLPRDPYLDGDYASVGSYKASDWGV